MQASGAPKPPEITTTEHYPSPSAMPNGPSRVEAGLRSHFGDDPVTEVTELTAPVSASEDFGLFRASTADTHRLDPRIS